MTEGDRDPFSAFDERLRAARRDRPEHGENGDERGPPNQFGQGLRSGIEVFGGVVGGLLIGAGLDMAFGTSPFLLVVFLFLGGAAGVRNAYRTLKRLVQDEDGR